MADLALFLLIMLMRCCTFTFEVLRKPRILTVIATLAAPSAVAGKDPHEDHPGHRVCKEEIQKFCGRKQGKEKKECIDANRAQFSQACQEDMANHEKKH